MNTKVQLLCRTLIVVGNVLTLIGCMGLVFAFANVFPAELFAVGISAGIRVIGSVAIAGCLLSAVGYGLSDYFKA